MPPEFPEEFAELMEGLTEGSLDEAGRAQLVAMIRADPGLRRTLAEHLAVSRALEELGRVEIGYGERTAAHVAKVAAEGEFDFARKVRMRIVRRRMLAGLAVAAVVALAATPFFLRERPQPEPAVAEMIRVSPEGSRQVPVPVAAGTVIEESGGLIRLDFRNGAVVAVEAPAKLTVVSGMEIALESGRLNGWCPDSAHGFKVSTGTADLIDLGTSFGVVASGSGSAEFVVLDGEVEVAKGDERRRLHPGEAVKTKRGDLLTSMAFDPSGFRNTWHLSHGILGTRGAVVPADPDIPEKLAAMESDDHVLVIPERRAVPFTFPLHAEITGPGTLPGTFGIEPKTVSPAAGKTLSSFLIRYNPVGTHPEDHFVEFEGEVTFDRPVLAIICARVTLEASDPAFATGTWDAVFRGIEVEQINNPPDQVTLSDDRRTVKVLFYAGASTDEVRVILED